MTNDEIKRALLERLPIVHEDRVRRTVIIYDYAKAWRVTVDKFGRFISSLELVTGGKIRSVTVALAEECKIQEEP